MFLSLNCRSETGSGHFTALCLFNKEIQVSFAYRTELYTDGMRWLRIVSHMLVTAGERERERENIE